MKTDELSFDLPPECVAQYPGGRREESRLLVIERDSGRRTHSTVKELACFLEEGSLLVFNDSKVRKARVSGLSAENGKRKEFLFTERTEKKPYIWKALTTGAYRLRPGSVFVFPEGKAGQITKHEDGLALMEFYEEIDEDWFERSGSVPLPPYIKRAAQEEDSERYQTVYAKEPGSAAAPTAGLHFTAEALEELRSKGIETVFITLHVGLGTFLPIHEERLEEHKMHSERFFIDGGAADKIERAKREGRRLVAVGTTALRALETAWEDGVLRRGEGRSRLFIYGDYKFKTADALFTNFHTPRSTLLALVSSFCGAHTGAESGRELILRSYKDAIEAGYRFFSYGDATLIK